MRKALVILFTLLYVGSLSAQTAFYDGFDNESLTNWTLVDADADGYNWTYIQGDDAHSASGCLFSSSFVSSGILDPDNWLISANPVSVPSIGYYLTWFVKEYDAPYPDHYSVYVSTSASLSDIASSSPLFSESVSHTSWQFRSLDLSAYAGQSVYIAFRHHESANMSSLFLDDVSVAIPPADPNISFVSLSLPTSARVGEEFSLSGLVRNLSATPLSSFVVTCSVDGAAPSSHNVSVPSISFGETHSFSLTLTAPTVPGQSTFTLSVSHPNGVDISLSDNQISSQMLICGSVAAFPHTQTFDSGFGCWTEIDADGDGQSWRTASSVFSSPTTYTYNQSPDALVSFSNYLETPLQPDNWLVSPAIEVPSDGAYVAKWFSAVHASYPDSYSVYVSTSPDIISFLSSGELLQISPSSDYRQSNLPLVNYAGSTIYIAFRHWNSDDNYYLLFDQFSIEPAFATPEVTLSKIITPVRVCAEDTLPISGVVRNNSTQPLTSFKVTYRLDGVYSSEYDFSCPPVPYGDSVVFTHPDSVLVTSGPHGLIVYITLPNGITDADPYDNEISHFINPCPLFTASSYTESFEGGLGCWLAFASDPDNDNDYGTMYTSAYIHSGAYGFRFASLYEVPSGDYRQYLLSPRISLSSDANISFYYSVPTGNYRGPESFTILYSTTTDALENFTPICDPIYSISTNWTLCQLSLPANTKYILFRYDSEHRAYLAIDDISIVQQGSPDDPDPDPEPEPEPQSIDQVTVDNVKIYPNPTTGDLHVEAEGLQRIELIDEVGRVMIDTSSDNVLRMGALPTGIYTVRLMVNNHTLLRKVVKK